MANHPISDLTPLFSETIRPNELAFDHCVDCLKLTDTVNVADRRYCPDCADERFDADGNELTKPAVYDLMARCSKCDSFDLATIFGDKLLCQVCFESDELPQASKAEAFVKYAAVAVISFAFGIYVAAEVVLNIVRANQ